MVVTEEGEAAREALSITRDDFWATTSNKQLNFVQHVRTLLQMHGRAAIVVPDNVLFEGGAGEIIRRRLLHDCDVHTLLRLLTGIFYLEEFVACYRPGARQDRDPTWSASDPSGRWRAYDYDELIQRDKCSLDVFWLKDESLEASENLPDPDVIARDIAEDLRAALAQFEEIAADLSGTREIG